MDYIIFGLKETRITLYQDDGTTPLYRVTLQKETKEGLELTFKREGVDHQLGSGSGWKIARILRGHRPFLDIKWTHGLESAVESWNGADWDPAATVATALALSLVHTWANRSPCLVSPHKDLNLDFSAQPDPGKGFLLRDIKGVVHTGLELHLIGEGLMNDIPDWPTLNSYFAAGYTDDGFAKFAP